MLDLKLQNFVDVFSVILDMFFFLLQKTPIGYVVQKLPKYITGRGQHFDNCGVVFTISLSSSFYQMYVSRAKQTNLRGVQ